MTSRPQDEGVVDFVTIVLMLGTKKREDGVRNCAKSFRDDPNKQIQKNLSQHKLVCTFFS